MKEIKVTLAAVNYSLRALTPESQKQLKAVVAAVGYGNPVEVTVRIPDPRQDWIDMWYKRAMVAVDHLGSCTLKFCKDTTIMIDRSPFPDITTSAPRHGDKYDRKTGIAVCYAKMRGETVPDFI